MSKNRTIATDAAPAAIGPYSQAIVSGGFLWCSGQIAMDPASGELTAQGIEAETRQVLANLEAVLAAGECTFEDLVRCTIYLADMEDFPIVNDLYAAALGTARPARATVAVAGLPKGARIEIDAVARVPS